MSMVERVAPEKPGMRELTGEQRAMLKGIDMASQVVRQALVDAAYKGRGKTDTVSSSMFKAEVSARAAIVMLLIHLTGDPTYERVLAALSEEEERG